LKVGIVQSGTFKHSAAQIGTFKGYIDKCCTGKTCASQIGKRKIHVSQHGLIEDRDTELSRVKINRVQA
jgi:hypothetical protein